MCVSHRQLTKNCREINRKQKDEYKQEIYSTCCTCLHPVMTTVAFSVISCSKIFISFYRTTESVRLRDNAVRKSLEIQKQKNDETLKAKRAKLKREKELRSQVTVKAMANDHSWQLRKSSEQKLKSFKYVLFSE